MIIYNTIISCYIGSCFYSILINMRYCPKNLKRGIVLLLLLACVACAPSLENTGRDFLLALQEHNFEEAAALATDDTAAIVLFMKEMLIANTETNELLELPLPVAEPRHVSTTEAEGYVILEFEAGKEKFVLHGIETEGKWKIRLPRSGW